MGATMGAGDNRATVDDSAWAGRPTPGGPGARCVTISRAPNQPCSTSLPDGLTAREVEVLALGR